MRRKVGRPIENTDIRERLLFQAGELFTAMSYDKVSTRLLAEKAGVNVAMIRYYFANKEGLFEAMVRDTMQPVQEKIRQLLDEGSQQGLIEVMRAYYRTMAQSPRFPKLMLQVMSMGPKDERRVLLEKIFMESAKPALDLIFDRMLENGEIRSGMEPILCRFTFVSLMVFPFIAPNAMLNFHGVEINETFLNRLLEHNINVLKQGFLEPEQPTSLELKNEN